MGAKLYMIWDTYGTNVRVQIPDELAERVQNAADSMGYNGVSDFSREAIRLRLEDIEDRNESDEH